MTEKPTQGASLDAIVEALESDIIFGHLRPYQELVEDALMTRFDAKRHTVRSAIEALVARQIVIKPRGKSARVKDFTLNEVEEIYYMRTLLQREAAHIMPLPVAASSLAAIKTLHMQYVAAVSVEADPLLIHQLNDTFHQHLFSLCQNHQLCKAIDFYTEASNPIRSYGITDKAWLQRAIDEHSAMIRAIEAEDRSALEGLVVSHMQPTRQRWEETRHGTP